MRRDQVVVIVGGGFSGSLLAINLLRHDGPKAVLIERGRGHLAKGLAFGSARPEHLLNVRASNMSALPDQPDHFLNWLGDDLDSVRNRFVARAQYGQYLHAMLMKASADSSGRLKIVTGEAVNVRRSGAEMRIELGDGSIIPCDALVLAQGNLPPADLPEFAGLSPDVYVPNPWRADAFAGLSVEDEVLLVGTGLTSVDVALTLNAAGFQGRITALSRRGLAPQQHLPTGPVVQKQQRPPVDGSWLVHHVRCRAREVGWHAAVDELRPHTQDLWRRAGAEGQKRFLRHLRPYWDVHRHRIAPSVAEQIGALQDERRLEFAGGKILAVEQSDDKAIVAWRVRGGDEVRRLHAARIINCTGPQGDLLKTADPLLTSLVQQGFIRPDPLHLGIDVGASGRVQNQKGIGHPNIYALGPMTRGDAWEIIAVPDIRVQAWSLARRLSSAHWVEGEGL